MYDETNKFSMADDSDEYDEYEEEVIERDEEYDPEDGEYDEEYDDEEYEDEYDEEEEPEEEYEDEEYDDGYDDQYYDDRLNQVLDELAELKRGMNSPAVQQQSPFPQMAPQMLYAMPQQNNNEVVMYNEISRLRDELSQTQNSQSMHVELTRLKEEMERDKRQNEAQFLSEIKRLNEKIEELQQPEKSRNQALAAPAPAPAGLLPEAQVSPKELNKLLGINETLLRATRDSDAKILSDIGDVKTRLESMDTVAVNSALADIRTAIDALADMRTAINALAERPQAVDPSAALAELSAAVAALKTAVGESQPTNIDPKLLSKLARVKTEGGNVDLTEVVRSVYELKGMLGSNDPNRQELVNMALKAYTDLDLLHVTVANSADFRSKLDAIENFVASVNAQDFITADALGAYAIVLKQVTDTPIDHNVFDALCSFGTATGKVTISTAKKDAVNKYIAFAERMKREELPAVMEFLPDLVTAINDAEGSKNVTSIGGIYNDVLSVYNDWNAAQDADKRAAEVEIRALLSELVDMRVSDIVTYAPVMPLPTSDAAGFADGDSVSDRLNIVMQTVENIADMVAQLQVGGVPPELPITDDVAATAQPETASEPTAQTAAYGDVEQLKTMLTALSAKLNLDAVTDELHRNFAGITGRLAGIESRLAGGEEPVVTETYEEAPQTVSADVLTAVENAGTALSNDIATQATEIIDRIGEKLENDESRAAVLEDLAAIKTKLEEHELFVSQIGDLRADILSIPEVLNTAEQTDKLYDDIVAQLDKLYEDLTAADAETSEKLAGELAEIKATIEGLAAADVSSSVLDGIVDFRTAYEENNSLSAADRAKLLEDIAYVREQVDKQLTAAETDVRNADVVEQVSALQASFDAGMQALQERIATLEAAETNAEAQSDAATENVSQQLSGITAALEELKEKSAALEDVIQTNGLLASENQATVNEEIGRILEQLTPPEGAEQTGVNVYDEIVSVSGRLEEIRAAYEQGNTDTLAALAEIKEQVHLKELEQSLATVSASEEERKSLLTEIAGLRERLSGLENEQHAQADSVSAQLGLIIDQISAIGESVQSGENRMNEGIELSGELVKMQDDITFIRNQIEATIDGTGEDDTIAESLENEGLSLIMDDIAAIKEKLASLDEYDTVAEILSLREDVKAARILDNNDVTAELEELKTDLRELKSDVSDIKATHADSAAAESGDTAPSGDEVNMLLGEIVSLRDEIQAYKDDVANLLTAQETSEIPTAVEGDNLAVILDELGGLHNELDALKTENLAGQAGEIEDIKTALSDIKDMISRRTTIAEDAAHDSAVSNELNVVLDEIINVKDEVATLKNDFVTAAENVAAERESDAQAEKAAFADEMQAFKNELYAMVSEKLEELSALNPDVAEEMQSVRDQLADLQALVVGGVVSSGDGEQGAAIYNELSEIKAMLAERPAAESAQTGVSADDVYNEVVALREDMEAARSAQPTAVTASGTVDLGPVTEQLEEIRAQIQDMSGVVPAETEQNTAVLNEVLALREELTTLREQMQTAPVAAASDIDNASVLGEILGLREEIAALREQAQSVPAVADTEPDAVVLGEIVSLREELAALREQMQAAPTAAESGTDNTLVLNEILGLREEIERMREGGRSEETAGLIETVGAIQEDVRAIKDEPDLGIINEVLALRDEFQAFKDEMQKTRTAPAEDKSKEELLQQVQSLRDQMFAISMANVNDGTSSEVVYESYNNIILDEITSLRDEIALIKQSDETRALGEELSQMKDRLTNIVIDDAEKTEARFAEIRSEIAELKARGNKAEVGETVMNELADLKAALANQKEADAAAMNFMSELAHLIERQNEAIGRVSNERLSDEIESLKAEIASSLAAPATTDDVRNEIAELKADLGRNLGGTVSVDNSAVLEEIAALRAEMNRRNREENSKVLKELAQLKKELGTISERDSDDGELSRSINDLKEELNQIAGFVDEEEAPAAAPKKNARRGKPGPKPGSKRKTPAKTVIENEGLSGDSLISKIDAASIAILGDDEMSLNPDYADESPIPATSAEMDLAAKLAKQVANKLIMEQLVQQLGDGGVPRSEVEEIVKDILPQEFTTVQVDEQTDKVRRLANSLVLDKLRSRLKK